MIRVLRVFPEENPANYVGDRFDPKGPEALRVADAKVADEEAKLNAEIASIIKKHRKPGSSGSGGK